MSTTTACPTCYRRLPAPGIAAHGHPITLPAPGDLDAVACRVDDERITLELASGLVASRPLGYSRRLAAATPEQRAAVAIERGHHLRWEEIDEDIDAAQFIGIPEDIGAAGRGADLRPYPAGSDEIERLRERVAALEDNRRGIEPAWDADRDELRRLRGTLAAMADDAGYLNRRHHELLERVVALEAALVTLRNVPGATEQVEGRCSGRSTFLASRLPAYIVFDYLVAGETIDDFCAAYPDAVREQVVALLEAVRDFLREPSPAIAGDDA